MHSPTARVPQHRRVVMAALRLKLRAKPPCLIDASPLVPDALTGKSRAEIDRIQLQGRNQTFALGDLFRVSGANAHELVLDGLDGSLVRVGASMQSGTLTIVGHAGDYAGESLRGGTLTVRGHAGDYLGAGMRAGSIMVSGDAGTFVGSARAGHTKGMTGGTILVRGNAGDRAGDRMRRGLLMIEGNAGRYCASRMLAGTIAVLGQVGTHAGYLMRRGTLILNDAASQPLPTFNLNGQPELLAIRLLVAWLVRRNPAFRPLTQARFTRWLGDLGAEGKGEMLIVSPTL
jgi:formylmethanofuran dehydrogenase subunit C